METAVSIPVGVMCTNSTSTHSVVRSQSPGPDVHRELRQLLLWRAGSSLPEC